MALILSLILQLYLIYGQGLSIDEIHRWLMADRSWREAWALSLRLSGGDVLFISILKWFRRLGSSPETVRCVGAAIHAVGIVLWVKWATPRLGRRAALWSAAAMALSPLHVIHGSELKEYSWLTPLTLVVAFRTLEDKNSWRVTGGLCVVEVISVLFFPPAAFFFAALATVKIVRGWSPRNIAIVALQHGPMAGAALGLYFLWDDSYRESFSVFARALPKDPFRVALDMLAAVEIWNWTDFALRPALSCVRPLPDGVVGALRVAETLSAAALVVVLIAAFRSPDDSARRWARTCAIVVAGHLVGYGLISILSGSFHLYQARVFFFSSPFLYGCLAVGFLSLRRFHRWVMAAPMAGLLLLSYAMVFAGAHPETGQRMGHVLRRVLVDAGAAGRFYVHPGFAVSYVEYLADGSKGSTFAPVGTGAFDREGWLGLMRAISQEEIDRWTEALSTDEPFWLLTLPGLLPWRDPEFALERNRCLALTQVSCDHQVALFRVSASGPGCEGDRP